MGRTAVSNNRGVTLIEVMISFVLILIVSLALMQTQLLGISTNVQNQLRDEAVNVVEMRLSQLRNRPFTEAVTHTDLAPTAGTPEAAVTRKIRGFTVDFTPSRQIVDISPEAKQITITVQWSYRGQNYTHGSTTIMIMRS